LVAVRGLLGIPEYIKIDFIIKAQIRQKIENLRKDDEMLVKEGIDKLYLEELQSALRARGSSFLNINSSLGMKGLSTDTQRLKSRLADWLELSQKHKLPYTILILSRAFVLTETPQAALKETLAAVGDKLLPEIQLKVEQQQGTITREKKIKFLEQEEKLIKQEAEQKTSVTQQISDQQVQNITEAVSKMASPGLKVEKSELLELQEEVSHQKQEIKKVLIFLSINLFFVGLCRCCCFATINYEIGQNVIVFGKTD
jgi:LETM1 and EF-hand domain-containing protein 1